METRSLASFALYVAAVVSVAALLFPPFTSLGGTERAFVLTGPEWSQRMGALGAELGLTARIHWAALLVQLGAVWAIALGTWWFLAPADAGDSSPPRQETHR